MKRQIRLLVLFLAAAILAGCGGSSSKTTSVPQATNPTQATPQDLSPTTPATQPSNLPDLSTAAAIKLTDNTNYQGLQDLAAAYQGGQVYPPLVGDAKFSMQLTSGATITDGNALIEFEDQQGDWWDQLAYFPGTGTQSTSAMDAIFADSDLVLRVNGTISSGTLSGSIYYRVRNANDPQFSSNGVTAPYCTEVTESCVETDPATGQTTVVDSSHCPNLPTIDTADPCKATYMDTSDTKDVKALGTFKVTYSNWTTLSK